MAECKEICYIRRADGGMSRTGAPLVLQSFPVATTDLNLCLPMTWFYVWCHSLDFTLQ